MKEEEKLKKGVIWEDRQERGAKIKYRANIKNMVSIDKLMCKIFRTSIELIVE